MSQTAVTAPFAATVAHVVAPPGTAVAEGDVLVYLEIMKMEQPVTAPVGGVVAAVDVVVGDGVAAGQRLALIGPAEAPAADRPAAPAGDGATGVRTDLAEVRRRRGLLADDARPEAVASRHDRGMRTARENVADLLDEGSFSEYGGLGIAAQRGRRGLDELLARTPADGLITGTGTVNADLVGPARARVAVAAYDYTVLAGTQGLTNHHKKDRLFRLAHTHRLPVVVFAEGGGGRPGDTDGAGASWLDAEAFELFARLSGRVPTVAIVNGRCFAGNAALAGSADVIIATEGSTLGMAGPAMIEGGGLGVVDPDDIGPMDVQVANGVVDVLVRDEAAAVAAAQQYLSYTQGPVAAPEPHDQTALRDAVPENRKRTYDVRRIVEVLADPGSVLELRPGFAPGVVTAFARIGGQPVGVVANDPRHLGGAIDADGADAVSRHLELCDAYGLAVVVLCDTPGFMVGPEAERDGGVRRFSRMFVAGARLGVPIIAVVTRKAYGLGAQAMLGGHLKVPALTVGWPTAELGPMGLEGAVRLGFRRELESIEDPDERAAREQALIDAAHAGARGLNVATYAEIDDVIDPADTRERILQTLAAVTPPTTA
ncbi:carboxyl transferase domain-containing protein [Euzebya sp.]|uniref:carboxyl transferase domain-containing protein n=1 Tax=Euzebya sp. TaxID=1971409 RepID=UPI0035135862